MPFLPLFACARRGAQALAPRPEPDLWRGLALCLPLALLGACTSVDQVKPIAARSAIQAPGKPRLIVSNANDGTAIKLEAAQDLQVDLPLGAGEVANNLDWVISDLKPGVLTLIGTRFERTGRDSNPTEADGTAVFRLKPKAPGRVTLTFALRRPYSLGTPSRSVSFDVTVE